MDERSGLMGWLLRLVPGATSQPTALAKNRLVIGVTILLLSMVLQTAPLAVRSQQVEPVVVRFGWYVLEMATLAVALSTAYHHNQRRRATIGATLAWTIAISAVVSLVFVLLYTLVVVPAVPSLRSDGPPRTMAFSITWGLVVGMLHTGVWALAFVFPYVAEDARLRALEADKLKIEAEQLKISAELSRLRSQLEPHFLLNTLNAIAGLVNENPREARRLIACLGELLRDALHDGDELQPLEDEVAWLRRYAEILESRHAGTLSFQWDIEPGTKRTLVPRLLLQPLVENAVKHGALRRTKKQEGCGLVTVRVRLADSDAKRKVVCEIEDNGPGLPNAEPRAGAFGLRSVRRRLELKFPDAVLRMESTAEGTRSIVELPSPTKENPKELS
ncbi:MAG: histidine kinase [Labilithrix sp.]|nr:histidine kinase [Labilithrix sp.]MCW5818021.1 histidine kinase [Labilithrix sp.]